MDAYRLALAVPDTLFILISGGALSTAFIPIFAPLLDKENEEAAWRMASGMLGAVAAGVMILAALAWIFAPQLLGSGLAAGTTPEARALAVDLVRILLVSPILLALGSVATAVLQSFEQFTLPAFAPIAYNLGIIFGATILGPPLGIYGVAVGVVIGAVGFFALQAPAAIRRGLRLPSAWPLRDPNVRDAFKLLIPRVVGQASVQASTLITLALAATLSAGSVAAFSFAWVLFTLPVGLFGTSLATATFPALSREAGGADAEGFLYLLRRSLRGVLFLVIPASAGLILLREPIIALIYQRGAFGARDTLLTAEPLLYFALGMWAYALVDMLPRAFYALHDSVTPLKFAMSVVVLDALLSLILVRVMGLGGLALAFSIATGVQVLLLLAALRRRVGPVLDAAARAFLLKAVLATGAMVAVLLLAGPLLAEYQSLAFPDLLARVGGSVAGGAAAYLGASVLLGQDEVGTLMRLARRGR